MSAARGICYECGVDIASQETCSECYSNRRDHIALLESALSAAQVEVAARNETIARLNEEHHKLNTWAHERIAALEELLRHATRFDKNPSQDGQACFVYPANGSWFWVHDGIAGMCDTRAEALAAIGLTTRG